MIVLTIEILDHECSSLFTSFYSQCHITRILPDIMNIGHVMLRSPCVRGTTCCLVSLHSSTTRHLAVGCKKQPAVSGAESQPKKKKNRPGNDDNSLRT